MCIRLHKTFEYAFQVLVFEDPPHDHVGLSTLDVHFFVHLRSFHLEMQILPINATMIRLNIASPTTSVCGNADSESFIPSSPVPKKLSADYGGRQL